MTNPGLLEQMETDRERECGRWRARRGNGGKGEGEGFNAALWGVVGGASELLYKLNKC